MAKKLFPKIPIIGITKPKILPKNWIDEIYSNEEELIIEGIEDTKENYSPLKPQYAINKIIGAFKDNYTLSDAGTHTTWTTLLKKCDEFGKLIFSGGFGPMGFALPGAIGVAIAHPNEKVIVICGDGDIQMVSQELATINEYNLNISIFLINNSQLGIIRQWEEDFYGFDFKYQVDLKNPDFVLHSWMNLIQISCDDPDKIDSALDEIEMLGGSIYLDFDLIHRYKFFELFSEVIQYDYNIALDRENIDKYVKLTHAPVDAVHITGTKLFKWGTFKFVLGYY